MTTYLGTAASQAAMLALTGRPGDWCNRSDLSTRWEIIGSDPTQLSGWAQTLYPAAQTRVTSVTSSATPTPSATTDDMYLLTALAAGATFAAPAGSPTQGQRLMVRIKDNGTARALAWNAIYRGVGVSLPTTTVASKNLYLGMIYNATDTKWDVVALSQEP